VNDTLKIAPSKGMLGTHVGMELDDDVGSQKKKDGLIRCSRPSFVSFSEARKKNEISHKRRSKRNLHKRNNGQKSLPDEGILTLDMPSFLIPTENSTHTSLHPFAWPLRKKCLF